jgi:hypothetical protein
MWVIFGVCEAEGLQPGGDGEHGPCSEFTKLMDRNLTGNIR